MFFSLCSFWLSLEQRLPGNSALEVLAFPSHTKSSLGPCQECNPSTSEECSWLLKAGSLIRAVEKGWKEHQCLPSFLLELFPAEISSQPPSKDIPQLHCHFYCLPTQEIHPQGLESCISRTGRCEGRVSGQCYSSLDQLSDPCGHLHIHSMLQTSQKN